MFLLFFHIILKWNVDFWLILPERDTYGYSLFTYSIIIIYYLCLILSLSFY